MEKYYQKIKEFAIYESDFAGILSERTFLAETWRGTAGSIRNGICIVVAAAGGYGNRSVQYDEQSDFRKDRYEFWKLAGTDEHGASGTGCNLRRKKPWLWNTGEYVSHRILCRLLHMDLEPGTAGRLFTALPVRIAVLIPSVILFILTAALYMDVDMGTAPYDAIPIIISGHLPKVPFKVIRIAFDFSVTMIGFSFGGKIGAMTVIMILALGPVIQWLGDIMKKHFPALTGEE